VKAKLAMGIVIALLTSAVLVNCAPPPAPPEPTEAPPTEAPPTEVPPTETPLPPPPAPEAIEIGAVVPLTGKYASGGAQVQVGYEYAVDDINAAGGGVRRRVRCEGTSEGIFSVFRGSPGSC
jgi:ABC-type branched-subunit amino acid transport system substrate-binding protein